MQLVYRAASYTFQPAAPALPPAALATLHTLLYRGQVYHHRQPAGHPASAAHTLNWRFSTVCTPRNADLQPAQA